MILSDLKVHPQDDKNPPGTESASKNIRWNSTSSSRQSPLRWPTNTTYSNNSNFVEASGLLDTSRKWLQSLVYQDLRTFPFLSRLVYRISFFLAYIVLWIIFKVSRICTLISLMITNKQLSVKISGSITSILVTNYRFHGYILGVCNDCFAENFASTYAKIEALSILLRGLCFGNYVLPYPVFSICGRCNRGDDEVKAAFQNGFSQVVILGAGNDTRLHRIAPLPRYVFEIDAERTQQYKMHHLSQKILNEDVVFVPVNFEEESWLDKLQNVGGDDVTNRKTLFIWEGVSYYLTNEAIRQTLSYISTFPAGSRVVFDVSNPTPRQLQNLNSVFRLFGEKWQSVFDESSLRNLLKEFNIEMDGEPLDAAAKAVHSADPSFEGKVRLPEHPTEQSFHRPFILVAGVVTKDSVSLF